VHLEARRGMGFQVLDLLSGQVVASHSLSEGESFKLSGAEACLIRGTYW
jgi:hypothetical protein